MKFSSMLAFTIFMDIKMRSIILNLAVTFDGMIEGPNGELDWIVKEEKTDFGDILSTRMSSFMDASLLRNLVTRSRPKVPAKRSRMLKPDEQ